MEFALAEKNFINQLEFVSMYATNQKMFQSVCGKDKYNVFFVPENFYL